MNDAQMVKKQGEEEEDELSQQPPEDIESLDLDIEDEKKERGEMPQLAKVEPLSKSKIVAKAEPKVEPIT